MEHRPQSNEQEVQLRPLLEVDLSTGDALPFNLVAMAMQKLEGDELARFNQTVWLATQQGSGATYNDLLRIVDRHTDLVDTSNSFPLYGREAKINGAVARLNEQLKTLPEDISPYVVDLYPDSEDDSTGLVAYLSVLEDDIRDIELDMGQCSEDQREQLGKYHAILVECTASLRRYDV